jgi:hypothetical protein
MIWAWSLQACIECWILGVVAAAQHDGFFVTAERRNSTESTLTRRQSIGVKSISSKAIFLLPHLFHRYHTPMGTSI